MMKLRIFGDQINKVDYWVDAVVDNIDIDGNVTLVEDVSNNPRSWTTTIDTLKTWRDDDLAAKHEDLPDSGHRIWNHGTDVWNDAADPPLKTQEHEISSP